MQQLLVPKHSESVLSHKHNDNDVEKNLFIRETLEETSRLHRKTVHIYGTEMRYNCKVFLPMDYNAN